MTDARPSFDAGWRWHYDGERYGIWLVGWRYA